jgi:multidrug efflux pump subunit AcrB
MSLWLAWVLRNRTGLLFGTLVLMLASLWAFAQLPKDVFPNAAFPRFRVVADTGFASLENTETGVTRPLEEALKTVADVQEVRSVTERGTSTIDIYLRWGANLQQDLQAVQTRVDEVRPNLPAGAAIEVTRMNTSAFPLSEYGLWSESLDLKQLYSTIKYTAIPRLIGVDGVADLTIVGGEEPEVWVKLDPRKLILYNLDATALETALDSANKISFIGQVDRGPQSLFVVGGRKLTDAKALRAVVVATRMGHLIRLSDIAEVSDASAQVRRIVSVDGHKGLLIDVRKQPEADALKVSAALDARMAEVAKDLDSRLHVSRWDLSDFVSRSIKGILFDILAGLAVILAIVLLVLRRFRYALPIILVMPIVLLIEFLVMRLLGQTVNIMTLGGLSAAIGIIADNAIVLTENHVHFRSMETKGALAASMTSIVPITVWATVVTMVVFVPLSLLSGVPGLFFGPLALTLASTILLSLGVAIVILPLFLHWLIEEPSSSPKKPEHDESKIFGRAKDLYLKLLNQGMAHQKFLAIGVILTVIVSALIFSRLPTGFLPEWDEGDMVLDSVQSAGTSIQEADRVSQKMEDIVSSMPDVRMHIRKTGTALGDAYHSPNIGEMIILLKEGHKQSTFVLMNQLRDRLNKALPDVDVDLHQMLPDRLGDLTGEAKPIVINLLGSDPALLWQASQDTRALLEKIPGLNGVSVDLPPTQPELKVSPHDERLSLLGLSSDSAFHYSQLALYGEEATVLQNGGRATPVRVFYQGDFLHNPASIPLIPIYTANGGVLPLGKLASYAEESNYPEIHHKNGILSIGVNAEISDRSLSDVVRDVQQALTQLRRPASILNWRGIIRTSNPLFGNCCWF